MHSHVLRAKPADLIILDFDGVVADSELLANTLLADYITSCGRPTSVDHAIARYMGRRWEDCERAIAEDFGAPLPPDFQERYRSFENGRMRRDVQPVPGVVEFLAANRSQRVCVASSSQLGWLEHVTDKFDLRHHLGANLFSASAVPRGKPAPDVFLYAADRMQVAPENCVVIEDSAAGVEGGVAAGMRVIGFLGGAHIRPGHRERLIDAGAVDVVASFTEVAQLLNLSAPTR